MGAGAKATTYVGLLRGINVGGKNKLPMQELRTLFTQAGCADVRTYIQSGNVAFSLSRANPERLAKEIEKRIEARFGFRAPVVLRTGKELANVARNNPFLAAGAPPEHLHVMFLAQAPGAPLIAALDPNRSPPDSFQVRGREVYLRLPNGAGRSKLTNAYFDAKLATLSTGRNWRTLLELVELAKGGNPMP